MSKKGKKRSLDKEDKVGLQVSIDTAKKQEILESEEKRMREDRNRVDNTKDKIEDKLVLIKNKWYRPSNISEEIRKTMLKNNERFSRDYRE